MASLLRNVLAVLLVFASSSALAAETWAEGRKVLHSCVYASSYEAEVSLFYRNDTLPWGTSVVLLYGWGGSDNGTPFDWAGRMTTPALAVAGYTWGATVRATTSTRSSPRYYEHIDFVWMVIRPDGSFFYDKGNNSTWGFYSGNISQLPAPCVSDSNFIGTPTPLPVVDVVRW